MEGDITKKRANWITKILEYDVDVRPTKTVHSRGLCEYLAQDLGPKDPEIATNESIMAISELREACWLEEQRHFMKTRIFPEGIPPEKGGSIGYIIAVSD